MPSHLILKITKINSDAHTLPIRTLTPREAVNLTKSAVVAKWKSQALAPVCQALKLFPEDHVASFPCDL